MMRREGNNAIPDSDRRQLFWGGRNGGGGKQVP